MKSKTAFAAILCCILTACSDVDKKQAETIPDQIIDHSYVDSMGAIVHHLHLALEINFNNKEITGKAKWELLDHVGKNMVVFDIRDMHINEVKVDEIPVEFNISPPDPLFGSALSIPIKEDSKSVSISYTTKPEAAALQWLDPEQTDSKRPFLYTQSQAILARSWVPSQDKPGIKFTYTARVKVPEGFLPLMSASNPTAPNDSSIYHFEMNRPIPSYLLALAAGHIEYKKLGEKSGVYAEPGMLEKSAYEFADLPSMIKSAEELYGPYRWGRYDVLVLPSSFPFGGMENPELTFATPTIIAGDRSLVALVAHELAHSWSGNLVTNATWDDFWLNEGFTVYFEQRIMEKIYGKEYSDMLTVLGYGELKNTLEQMGADDPDSKLKLELSGRDPDEGVSDIAYEKGRFFLRWLERQYGREKWDAFVNAYFGQHAFGTITTEEFLEYLDKNLVLPHSENPKEINKTIQEWVYGTGMPKDFDPPLSAEFGHVESFAKQYLNGLVDPEFVQHPEWTTHHWLHFLRNMPAQPDSALVASLEKDFQFGKSGNAEILNDWYLIAIKADYRKAFPGLENFLVNVGRRKFLKPLYTALSKDAEHKKWALQVYKKARPGYHSVSYHTIDDILGYKP